LPAWRVVEKTQNALATAVRGVEEKLAVAPCHVQRLQDVKIRSVLDSTATVARRFVEIDDNSVQWVSGIDFAVNFPDEFFVSSRYREFVAASKNFSALNNEAGEHLVLPGDALPCYFHACQGKP
jgi:hypothetical protein